MEIWTSQAGAVWDFDCSALPDTLAQFAYALDKSSPCFCCGSPLVTSTTSLGEALMCPRCGAEVAAEQSVVLRWAA